MRLARACAGSSDHAAAPITPFDRPLTNRSICCCGRGCRFCRYPFPGIAICRDMALSLILVVRGSRCARKQDGRWRLILQRQIEKCGERRKCVDANKRLSYQKLGGRTCRPVEHPCWHLKPPICLRSIHRTAKNNAASLVGCPMNANSATKPRMMPIKNLAKNGPVGVLKPRCTMGPARIYPWRKMRRSRAPSIAPGTFFVAQSWADCITNMAGFNLRQAQAALNLRHKLFRHVDGNTTSVCATVQDITLMLLARQTCRAILAD